MFVMPKAFPIEFRRDVVAVAREADTEDGVRPGVTAAESAELR